jgi:hypothetical protein
MAQITVTRQADGTFRVQTPAGASHQVSVPAGFSASLGCSHVEPGELVWASFEFLLEREPATLVLHEYSLDLISLYFLGYTAEIRPPARQVRYAPLDPPHPPAEKISQPLQAQAGRVKPVTAVARGELPDWRNRVATREQAGFATRPGRTGTRPTSGR